MGVPLRLTVKLVAPCGISTNPLLSGDISSPVLNVTLTPVRSMMYVPLLPKFFHTTVMSLPSISLSGTTSAM